MLGSFRSIRRLTRAVPTVAWALLVLALVLRLAFVAATPDYRPHHDDRDYDRLACALVSGDGYPGVSPRPPADDECRRGKVHSGPTAFRPPGYPIFLAATYTIANPLGVDRWTTGRVAQALLGALAAGLIGLIAGKLWGRITGLIALGLAAVFPPLILVGGSLLTEPLFIALMLGAIAALMSYRNSPRRSRLLLAAVLTGLATLTRSNAFVLILPFALAVLAVRPASPRTRAVRVAAFVGVVVLTVAPWTIRNALAFHAFVPVTTEVGSALAGTYNDSSRTTTRYPGHWTIPGNVPEIHAVLATAPHDEPAQATKMVRFALTYIGDHPTYVGEVAGLNTLRLMNLDGPSWWQLSADSISQERLPADVAGYGFYPVLALALVGAFMPGARRAPRWVWLVPVLLWLSVVPIVTELRFRSPLEPFLLMLAALPIAALTERRQRRPDTGRGPRREGVTGGA